MVRWFDNILYMRLPVDICRGVIAPIIFILDIFDSIFLEAKSTEVKDIVVRQIRVVEVYCKRSKWNVVVDWGLSVLFCN